MKTERITIAVSLCLMFISLTCTISAGFFFNGESQILFFTSYTFLIYEFVHTVLYVCLIVNSHRFHNLWLIVNPIVSLVMLSLMIYFVIIKQEYFINLLINGISMLSGLSVNLVYYLVTKFDRNEKMIK